MLLPVVEAHAINVVDKGLGRNALGQDQRLVVELDMVIDEGLRHVGVADDRRAIHQGAGLYQDVIDEEPVAGRDQQVARRNILAQGARPDADRQNAEGIREPGRDGLSADPEHRHSAPIVGQNEIADRQLLDSHGSRRSSDARPGHEADRAALARVQRVGRVGGLLCEGEEMDRAVLRSRKESDLVTAAVVRTAHIGVDLTVVGKRVAGLQIRDGRRRDLLTAVLDLVFVSLAGGGGIVFIKRCGLRHDAPRPNGKQ